MKKFQFTHILLAAALMTTALPMQAQVPAQSQNLTFKQKAKNRFNESVTRFKRCLKRECSRGELVKVGKDLVAAVGALIVVGGIGYITTRKKSQPAVSSQFNVGDVVAIGTPPFRPKEEVDVFVIDEIDPQTGHLLAYRYGSKEKLPFRVRKNDTISPISDTSKIVKGTFTMGMGTRYFIKHKDLVPQVAPAAASASGLAQPQFQRKDIVALIKKGQPTNKLYVYMIDQTDPLTVVAYEDRKNFDAISQLVQPEQLVPVTDMSKIKEENLYGTKGYYIEYEG